MKDSEPNARKHSPNLSCTCVVRECRCYFLLSRSDRPLRTIETSTVEMKDYFIIINISYHLYAGCL
jgi:hypothetical protein